MNFYIVTFPNPTMTDFLFLDNAFYITCTVTKKIPWKKSPPPFNITYHNLLIVDRYQPKVCGCFEKHYWSRLKINMSLSSTFKEPHD